MTAGEVHAVLDALASAGCPAWISGGWGVDALVGRQTRVHRDLDLGIAAERESAALEALAGLGYVVETDWRPVRVEVVSGGRGRVDLHPLVFDRAGDGHQAGLDGGGFRWPRECFTSGVIGGRRVGCISVEQQLRFHGGYEPRDVDRADVALLHRAGSAVVVDRGGDVAGAQRLDPQWCHAEMLPAARAVVHPFRVGCPRQDDRQRPLGSRPATSYQRSPDSRSR